MRDLSFEETIVTPVITLCFALGTALELYGLKVVSTQISVVNTLNLIMLTFLVGVVVGRSWGKHYFEKMQWHLKSRTLPNDEVLNGTVMTIASMLLITPGVITDVLGLFILIPITRGIFKEITLDLVKKKISRGELFFFFRN